MKRSILILFFGLFSAVLSAPPFEVVYIAIPKEINAYDPLIRAITTVESMNGKYVYNEKENAVGWFQIRQVRIDDFNNRTGKAYTLADCYDYEISKEVFLFFCQGRDFESVAKSWNGSGPMTEIYWQKIKNKLKT
jgi:hypothetical protein